MAWTTTNLLLQQLAEKVVELENRLKELEARLTDIERELTERPEIERPE